MTTSVTMLFVSKDGKDTDIMGGAWEADFGDETHETCDEQVLWDVINDSYIKRSYYLLAVMCAEDYEILRKREQGNHKVIWDFNAWVVKEGGDAYGMRRCSGYYEYYGGGAPATAAPKGKQPEVSLEVWRRTPINPEAAWDAVLALCN